MSVHPGCHCVACERDRLNSDRQWQKVIVRSRDSAHRRGQEWTAREDETASREDLTNEQIAAMIGRSVDAVMRRRRRIGVRRQRAARGLPKTCAPGLGWPL